MVTAPLLPPEEGQVENLLFPFCSVPPLALRPVVPKTSKKRAVSFFSGSQEGEDGSTRDPVSTLPSPSPFALPKPCPFSCLCLSPVLSSVPTGVGGLAGFRRALEGVSNSGIFQGIPLVSQTDITSNVTD